MVRSVRVLDRATGGVAELAAIECGFGVPGQPVQARPGARGARGRARPAPRAAAWSATPSWPGPSGVEVGATAPADDVREAVLQLRRAKGMVLDARDPDTRSAGSFFTNPVLAPDDPRLAALPGAGAALPGPGRRGQGVRGLADRAVRARQGLRARRRTHLDQAHARPHQPRRGDDGAAARAGGRGASRPSGTGSASTWSPSRSWSAAPCPADQPVRSDRASQASIPASSRTLDVAGARLGQHRPAASPASASSSRCRAPAAPARTGRPARRRTAAGRRHPARPGPRVHERSQRHPGDRRVDPQREVRRRADLAGHAALGEQLDDRRVLDRPDPVPDPDRAQRLDAGAHAGRAEQLATVRHRRQPGPPRRSGTPPRSRSGVPRRSSLARPKPTTPRPAYCGGEPGQRPRLQRVLGPVRADDDADADPGRARSRRPPRPARARGTRSGHRSGPRSRWGRPGSPASPSRPRARRAATSCSSRRTSASLRSTDRAAS